MSRWLGDFRDMEVGASYIPAAFTDTKVTLYCYIATALLRLRRFPWRIVSRSSRFVRWPAVHAVLAVATIIFVKNPSPMPMARTPASSRSRAISHHRPSPLALPQSRGRYYKYFITHYLVYITVHVFEITATAHTRPRTRD